MGFAFSASESPVSLPRGGGALRSLGEAFAPDLHTGTGSYAIPIQLPAGRNGFQPQLSLTYSSGSGNGPFGLGWALSVPEIRRRTSRGIPLYDDHLDGFLLSGFEDLVRVSDDGSGVTRYRSRTDSLTTRIEHHRGQSGNHWQVMSADGSRSLYGLSSTQGSASPVIADPASPSHICCWKLAQVIDVFGNRIEYFYDREANRHDAAHHWDQVYLSEIRYVDHGDPSDPTFLLRVRFRYETRPDAMSEYRAGFEVRTTRRCTRIDVTTDQDTEILARSYHLEYLDQQEGRTAELPPNQVSLLSHVRLEGVDGETRESWPPLEFRYARFDPQQRDLRPIVVPEMPPGALGSRDYELIDLTGDGLPDVLQLNGVARYWQNLGDGRFDPPRHMPSAPLGFRLGDSGVQLSDANGDGRVDLLVATGAIAGYFPLQFRTFWDERSFRRHDAAPTFRLDDPDVRFVDLDGDGITDAIRSGSRLEHYFNDPRRGWYKTRVQERRSLDEFPNVQFSDPRVRLADMTGDGLQDIVWIHDGNIKYWPNLGHGNWGRCIDMRTSPRLPSGYDPRRVLLGDVDGDGVADVVYVADGSVTLWINQCGNQWSEPFLIAGTPPLSDVDVVRLVDMLGTGVAGVLWDRAYGGGTRSSMFFLDFTAHGKPYVMTEIDNHTGGLTRITYAPSTQFCRADEQQLATRWQTPLPFPVHVVARLEVFDQISGGVLTSDFRYHHGYWDGTDREFRGFGRVDQRDTETLGDGTIGTFTGPDGTLSPPVESRTWFHQGPIREDGEEVRESDFAAEYWPGDPQVLERPPEMLALLKRLPRRARADALRSLRGIMLRTELYALDGDSRQHRPYSVTESLYSTREIAPVDDDDPDRLRIFFPHKVAQRSALWERGDEPMVRFTFTPDYDEHGHPLSSITIAPPRHPDTSEPCLAAVTINDYAHRDDDTRFLTGRTVRVRTYDVTQLGPIDPFALRDGIRGDAVSRRLTGCSLNFYDGPAFEGLPYGHLGDYGLISRTESLVFTEEILERAHPEGIPPYFTASDLIAWPDEYPLEFRETLPPRGGYVFHEGDDVFERGFYAASLQQRFDVQQSADGTGRGLRTGMRDPLGRETVVEHDSFDLFPLRLTNAVGAVTAFTYDYRVMQPTSLTDANGNRTRVGFTPMGLPAWTAISGKDGEAVGDSLDAPSTRHVYDLFAWTDPQRRQPISVRTVRRVHHVHDAGVPIAQRDDTIEAVEYSDGFGRLLQTRSQSDDVIFGSPSFGGAVLPGDFSSPNPPAVGDAASADVVRVLVSGWKTYDNKGRVVEAYESFFSNGFAYAPPGVEHLGEKLRLFYDPRGQLVRTAHPNGSQVRTVHGVPLDLSTPHRFTPTPWETYTYDQNDNAGRTHPQGSLTYSHHWNTPSSGEVDALGRGIRTVVRNGPDPTDWLTTTSTYDSQGNLLMVTDPLGRPTVRHVYDLARNALRSESVDSGIRRIVLDATGVPIEIRDGNGAMVLRHYDVLGRQDRVWARDAEGLSLTLRERLEYR